MPIISSPAAPFKGGTVPNATTFTAPVTVAPTTDADALTITTHGPQSFFDNIIIANSSDVVGVFSVDNAGEIALRSPASSAPLVINNTHVVDLTSSDQVSMSLVSPIAAITSGALPTIQLVTATAAQISVARDVETITPCTFNPGAATTATVTVGLSMDNVTYSTLGVETEPAGVALDGTIHLVKVRVPAGWYLKLTVNAQAVLGLTTYY